MKNDFKVTIDISTLMTFDEGKFFFDFYAESDSGENEKKLKEKVLRHYDFFLRSHQSTLNELTSDGKPSLDKDEEIAAMMRTNVEQGVSLGLVEEGLIKSMATQVSLALHNFRKMAIEGDPRHLAEIKRQFAKSSSRGINITEVAAKLKMEPPNKKSESESDENLEMKPDKESLALYSVRKMLWDVITVGRIPAEHIVKQTPAKRYTSTQRLAKFTLMFSFFAGIFFTAGLFLMGYGGIFTKILGFCMFLPSAAYGYSLNSVKQEPVNKK